MSEFTPDRRPQRPDISVTQSTVQGYSFIRDHFHQLVAWGSLPIILNFLNYVAVDAFTDGNSVFATFLYGLPGTVAFAWYACIQARLHIFGIRHPFPDQAIFNGISFYILFQMAMVLVSYAVMGGMENLAHNEQAMENNLPANRMFTIFAGMLVMLWMLKFGVLHLIAVAGLDVRHYLERAKGFWFSFTLVGVGFVSSLPVLMIFIFILSMVSPNPDSVAENSARFGIYALGSIMSWSVITVLNAALVETLKQFYTPQTKNRG